MEAELELLTVALDITPIQAKIIDTLLRKPLTRFEELSVITSGHVQAYIYRLRNRLRGTGITIDCRYRMGYSLGTTARQLISGKLTEYRALTTSDFERPWL